MNEERLRKAIEKTVYWNKKYKLIMEVRRNSEEIDPALEDLMIRTRTHLLASTTWLATVYEEETGKSIERIGNLATITEIRRKLARGEEPYFL